MAPKLKIRISSAEEVFILIKKILMLKSNRFLLKTLSRVTAFSNSTYVSGLYDHWKKDRSSVGQQWDEYFQKAKVVTQTVPTDQNVEKRVELMFKCYNMMR